MKKIALITALVIGSVSAAAAQTVPHYYDTPSSGAWQNDASQANKFAGENGGA